MISLVPIKRKVTYHMAASIGNYLNCPVLLYDEDGNDISRSKIVEYDMNSKRVILETVPSCLKDGDTYRLLILTEPSPREYQGRFKRDIWGEYFALFRGQAREGRQAMRHKVNMLAFIENMIYDGKAYTLLKPLEIQLINISVGGMRFRAPLNALTSGDRFQTSVALKDEKKLLIAEVVNHRQANQTSAEYGCRFLIAK